MPDELFPNNRKRAEARLKNNKKKFSRGKQYHQDYARFMEDMIRKGYTENAVKQVEQAKTWFVPQHGVYHASKPGKVHVVFC